MTSQAPSKPSRSQIENALAGSEQLSDKKKRRAAEPDFHFEASPRRQQVIGGDLTGVAKRNKAGLLGRYGQISIANWLAVIIVILILLAFFWPKGVEPIREVNDSTNPTPASSIYTEALLEEEVEPDLPITSFGRENDLDRATQFREADELELQIRALMTEAEAFVEEGQYTEPANNNATNAYQNILKLSPNNVSAKQGLDYINNRFLSSGLEALSENKLISAQTSLAKLETVNNDSDQYIELSASIENWKIQRNIDELLSDASKAKNAGQLILPARENALFYYQQVQVLDESNAAASSGINDIANSYVNRANQAIMQGQYEAATGYLATVSVIDPKHESIALLEAMITKAEPIADRTNQVRETRAQNTPPPASRPSNNESSADQRTATTAQINTPAPQTSNPEQKRVSANRTPQKEASEQAAFDKQYLNRGLAAYYRGDYDAAAALLQPLADKGVSRAQVRIANMHYLGRGFKRDRKEADRIIRAALPAIQKFADEGRTWAQSDLGSLYEDGLVLPRDYGEAVYWYRSAAESGYPGAQTNLGIMYARGRGVTTSRRTAIEWFQRAAKQGDILAKKNLDAMGVKQ